MLLRASVLQAPYSNRSERNTESTLPTFHGSVRVARDLKTF